MRTTSHLWGYSSDAKNCFSCYLICILYVMNLLKKILLYNSPSNVVERLREMNAKQRFLFADVIIMLFATIFFYNASDIFDKQHIKSEIEEFRINSIENGLLSFQQ